jgi:hypothetical protein
MSSVAFRIQSFVFLALLAAAAGPSVAKAQTPKYPPLDEYLMPRDAEVGLARSAAPASVSDRATARS